MFEDWSDPYDIDRHYENVETIFQKVADFVNPATQPSPPQPLTSPVPQAPQAPQAPQVQPSIVQRVVDFVNPQAPSAVQSKFAVNPDSIYVDGHPVGSQPKYNILRSGPPEGYRNKYSCGDSFDMTTLIMIFIIFVMFSYIIHLHMSSRNNNQLICLLMHQLLAHKK